MFIVVLLKGLDCLLHSSLGTKVKVGEGVCISLYLSRSLFFSLLNLWKALKYYLKNYCQHGKKSLVFIYLSIYLFIYSLILSLSYSFVFCYILLSLFRALIVHEEIYFIIIIIIIITIYFFLQDIQYPLHNLGFVSSLLLPLFHGFKSEKEKILLMRCGPKFK